MFCNTCGEPLTAHDLKCPCCGVDITDEQRANAQEQYVFSYGTTVNEPASTGPEYSPPPAEKNTSFSTIIHTQAGTIDTRDIIMIVFSFIAPVVGIIFGIKNLKNGKKVVGTVCMILGVFETLLFFLPFIFVFLAAFLDGILLA